MCSLLCPLHNSPAFIMIRVLVYVGILVLIQSAASQTVNGNWGQWTAYGACSVTCGVGTHQRTRSCDSPAPSGGGTTCPGDALEAKTCFDVTCYPSILGSLERNCSWTFFGCKVGSMSCIDFSFRCDGKNDCDDGSDESPEVAGCPTVCGDNGADTPLVSALATVVLAACGILTMKVLVLKD
ncbi:coadhesin-like isoform X1 [Crassostrea angulata]|uniref:coadhesin-like isoform X1 n=2 Tax=Magallana angulata TaxID=2784310 RepID=UPI0022B0FD21|nr:coadhesin-like isoform X1 [Crassostrea angulata]